jgi:hypothetical protein
MAFATRSGKIGALLAGLTFLLAAGCQSSSTSDGTEVSRQSQAGQSRNAASKGGSIAAERRSVVVQDFLFEVAHLHSDPGLLPPPTGPVRRTLQHLQAGETPAHQAARFSTLLADTIASALAEEEVPVRREPAGSILPETGLMVEGGFVEVDEGNRLRRAVVGFGAGATETLVQVSIYDVVQGREHPVVVYGTGTGSKPLPGGLIFMNPFAMAAKYVLSRNATDKDVRALGRRIARDLVQLRLPDGP